ncbi:hypothetical protein [Escherichia coli]|uniref:hypothetical protein n=1 Tax=Escherichia coli TaxID=562 RepID=UPI001F317235|nr:hypothetical protein [Escherichia coli]
MSVLETFMILFESDASDVKKGTDAANKSAETLDKTLSKIGITTDGITSSFSGLATVALGSMAAFLSLGGIISGTIEKAEEIDALARSAQSLNMPVEDLDAWGKLRNARAATRRVCAIRSLILLKKWVKRHRTQNLARPNHFRNSASR